MSDKMIENPNSIDCKICLNEIPESVSASAEADGYVLNYCGLESYQQWRDKQGDVTL